MKSFQTKFFIDQTVINNTGVDNLELTKRLMVYLDKLNAILRKSTIIELLFNSSAIIPDGGRPYDGAAPLNNPREGYEFWIHLRSPRNIGQSGRASHLFDSSGASVCVCDAVKIYEPENTSEDFILRQIGSLIHEVGHTFIFPIELYDLAVIPDRSDILPNLTVDVRNSRDYASFSKLPWFSKRPDMYYDPMSEFAYSFDFSKVQFCKLFSAFINNLYKTGNIQDLPPIPDLNKISILTEPGAKVSILQTEKDSNNPDTTSKTSLIVEGFADSMGLFNFNWGVGNWTELTTFPGRLRFVKVNKDGFEPKGAIIDVLDLLEVGMKNGKMALYSENIPLVKSAQTTLPVVVPPIVIPPVVVPTTPPVVVTPPPVVVVPPVTSTGSSQHIPNGSIVLSPENLTLLSNVRQSILTLKDDANNINAKVQKALSDMAALINNIAGK